MNELSAEDKLKLKRFCQSITENPRRIQDQPHIREGTGLMCEDWEMIEVCKFLFHGKEAYYGDPPPNRLKQNPLFKKEAIERAVEQLWDETGGNVDTMIQDMKTQRARPHAA